MRHSLLVLARLCRHYRLDLAGSAANSATPVIETQPGVGYHITGT